MGRYGRKHIRCGIIMYYLANSHMKAMQLEQAYDLLGEALEISIATLGESCTELCKLYESMGMVCKCMNNLPSAMYFTRKSLKVWCEIQGKGRIMHKDKGKHEGRRIDSQKIMK